MEGVLLVLLINFYMKDLFELVIEMFYRLSSTNQYFFTLFIVVQDFRKNIYHQKIIKYIDDDRSGVLPKQEIRKKYNSKINLIIQINIML